jgi:hypothetical protein
MDDFAKNRSLLPASGGFGRLPFDDGLPSGA